MNVSGWPAAVTAEPVDAGAIPGLAGDLMAVYEAAFCKPPYYETPAHAARFACRLDRYSAIPGFRCRLASDGTDAVGFALGFSNQIETFEPDRYRSIYAAAGTATTTTWLHGQFEFVELAVRPEHQGRGLGGLLHDVLLEGLGHRAAWLLTSPAADAARAFYRRRGWTERTACTVGACRRLLLTRPVHPVASQRPCVPSRPPHT